MMNGLSRMEVVQEVVNTTPIAVCKQDQNMFAPNADFHMISGQS